MVAKLKILNRTDKIARCIKEDIFHAPIDCTHTPPIVPLTKCTLALEEETLVVVWQRVGALVAEGAAL